MSNRWCILGSPRSGSNYLEEIIYNNISIGATVDIPAVKLAEYFHLHWLYYYDSNQKTFVRNMENTFLDDQGIEFRSRIDDLIVNSSRPMVMRIFPYLWHKKYIDIGNYVSFLKENGFKLLYLERSVFSRVISLSVAKTSNIWHKYDVAGNVFYNTTDGNRPDVKVEPITLDLGNLAGNFLETKLNDYCLGQLMAEHGGNVINYETIESDCQNLGIHIHKRTNIQKLYQNLDYSNIITNYQEAIQLLNCLNDGRH